MSESVLYFLVYKDSARMMSLALSEHETLYLARQNRRKMIRKGIYTKEDLHITFRSAAFGEGCYGF